MHRAHQVWMDEIELSIELSSTSTMAHFQQVETRNMQVMNVNVSCRHANNTIVMYIEVEIGIHSV